MQCTNSVTIRFIHVFLNACFTSFFSCPKTLLNGTFESWVIGGAAVNWDGTQNHEALPQISMLLGVYRKKASSLGRL